MIELHYSNSYDEILTMCTKRRVDFPLLFEWVDLDCKQITITKETQDEREAHFISSTVNNLYFVDRKSFQFFHTETNIIWKYSKTFRITWFWKLCKQDSLAIKKNCIQTSKILIKCSKNTLPFLEIFLIFFCMNIYVKKKAESNTFDFYVLLSFCLRACWRCVYVWYYLYQ